MHVVAVYPGNVGVGDHNEWKVAEGLDAVSQSYWYQGETKVC